MADTLSCPECGAEVESMEQLEAEHEVAEIEPQEDGEFRLFENRDLFLCKNCKNPMGVSRQKRAERAAKEQKQAETSE